MCTWYIVSCRTFFTLHSFVAAPVFSFVLILNESSDVSSSEIGIGIGIGFRYRIVSNSIIGIVSSLIVSIGIVSYRSRLSVSYRIVFFFIGIVSYRTRLSVSYRKVSNSIIGIVSHCIELVQMYRIAVVYRYRIESFFCLSVSYRIEIDCRYRIEKYRTRISVSYRIVSNSFKCIVSYRTRLSVDIHQYTRGSSDCDSSQIHSSTQELVECYL